MSVGALHGYTVAVTADRRWDEQVQLLERRGARVVHGPTIRTLPLGDEGRLRIATEALIDDPPDLVVLTTGLGVRGWLGGAESLGLGDELLEALRPALVLARGPKAEGAAMTAGIEVDWRTPTSRNRELLEHLAASTAEAHRADGRPGTTAPGSRSSSTVRPTSGWARPSPRWASTSCPCPCTGGSCQRTGHRPSG